MTTNLNNHHQKSFLIFFVHSSTNRAYCPTKLKMKKTLYQTIKPTIYVNKAPRQTIKSFIHDSNSTALTFFFHIVSKSIVSNSLNIFSDFNIFIKYFHLKQLMMEMMDVEWCIKEHSQKLIEFL